MIEHSKLYRLEVAAKRYRTLEGKTSGIWLFYSKL